LSGSVNKGAIVSTTDIKDVVKEKYGQATYFVSPMQQQK
jgi:hypothetical protein